MDGSPFTKPEMQEIGPVYNGPLMRLWRKLRRTPLTAEEQRTLDMLAVVENDQ